MKILQILVSLFLFILTYDTLTVFLWPSKYTSFQQNEEPEWEKGRAKSGREEEGSGRMGSTPWAVGGASLIGLLLARFLLRRRSKKGKVADQFDQVQQGLVVGDDGDTLASCYGRRLDKTESFLTCRQLSQMSICTEPELVPNNSEVRMVAVEDVQMLFDEWRNVTEDKLEHFDQRLSEFENSNRLCLKRIEQTESELSFIHHQMFLLAHKTRLPNLSDVPDSQQQIETMKDLTKILVEVKEQFTEDGSRKSSEVQTADTIEGSSCEEVVVAVAMGVEDVFETDEFKEENPAKNFDPESTHVVVENSPAEEPSVELRLRALEEEATPASWRQVSATTNLPQPLAPPPPHRPITPQSCIRNSETSVSSGSTRIKTPESKSRPIEVRQRTPEAKAKPSTATLVKSPDLRAKSVEYHHQQVSPTSTGGGSTSVAEVRGASAQGVPCANIRKPIIVDIPPTETKKIHFADLEEKKKGDQHTGDLKARMRRPSPKTNVRSTVASYIRGKR